MPMTLRIALPIAPATETHCASAAGICPRLRFSGNWINCGAFDQPVAHIDGAIGERYPARLAQCLAAEQSPWTEQRPTEGVWWVALRPEIRHSGDTVHAVTVQHGRVYCEEELCGSVDGPGFDGAKWMRRVQPADPFAGGE